MTHAELTLLAAVYFVYLVDCLVWLKPGETAYTRTASGWRAHTVERLSFTLAGRRPILADPLLLCPGFLRPSTTPSPRTLSRITHRLNTQWMLLLLCRAQAILLLLYLPLLLWMHRLVAAWPFYIGMLLLLHILICIMAARALRSASAANRGTIIASLVVNPVGATRIFTPLSQSLCDQAIQRNERKIKRA